MRKGEKRDVNTIENSEEGDDEDEKEKEDEITKNEAKAAAAKLSCEEEDSATVEGDDIVTPPEISTEPLLWPIVTAVEDVPSSTLPAAATSEPTVWPAAPVGVARGALGTVAAGHADVLDQILGILLFLAFPSLSSAAFEPWQCVGFDTGGRASPLLLYSVTFRVNELAEAMCILGCLAK